MPRKPPKIKGVYELEPGKWCGRFRTPEGKLVRKTFGRDRQAAIDWVDDARLARRSGEKLPDSAKVKIEKPKPAPVGAVTIDMLASEFLEYIKKNPDEYRDQVNPPRRIEQIRNAFAGRIAAEVTTPEVEDWLEDVQEDREVANATINKLRSTFSMFYKHGKRRGIIDVNPAEDVPLKDTGNGIERYLLVDEEKALRKVLKSDIESHDPKRQPILREQATQRLLEFDVSIRSGMRRSEQYNLIWPDVSFERKTMRLRKTKNGKPRNAYIIADVEKALKEMKKLTLTSRGRSKEQPSKQPKNKVFSKMDNKNWWKSALKRAGIENYRWHDNRHTFCSRLVQRGVPLNAVKEAAGHASIASTMRYAHLAPSHVQKEMEVLNWENWTE
jgi:site-specific recombinase XerD